MIRAVLVEASLSYYGHADDYYTKILGTEYYGTFYLRLDIGHGSYHRV